MINVIGIDPDAWASKIECIGPDYGKVTYDKLPCQSLQKGFYSYEKLYSEKAVIELMKEAYVKGSNDCHDAYFKARNGYNSSIMCYGGIYED